MNTFSRSAVTATFRVSFRRSSELGGEIEEVGLTVSIFSISSAMKSPSPRRPRSAKSDRPITLL